MTSIYIRHANGEIMEVQNWDTLTDYGAMVMRPLTHEERDRYYSLKQTLHMRDSEIWRLFHPPVSKTKVAPSSTRPIPRTGQFSTPPSDKPSPDDNLLSQTSSSGSSASKASVTGISSSASPSNLAKINEQHSDIEISTRELSKRALLLIIQRACGRDIEPLKEFAREDLLALASGILPSSGIPVRVIPRLVA